MPSSLSPRQLPDYLAHVDRRLSQESDRLLHYLHKSTRSASHPAFSPPPLTPSSPYALLSPTVGSLRCRKPLMLCVEKQLIGEHQQEILDKGERNHLSRRPVLLSLLPFLPLLLLLSHPPSLLLHHSSFIPLYMCMCRF